MTTGVAKYGKVKMNIAKNVGEYRHYEVCRFCSRESLVQALNLGYVPLAGGFLKKRSDFAKEKFYPLSVSFCEECFLFQVDNVVDPDTLFQNYSYHTSTIQTLVDHFESFAQELAQEYNPRKFKILEIGCNDGPFIKSLIDKGFSPLGVDPARNIVTPLIKKGLPIIASYFTERLAKKIVMQHGQFDAIVSFNTLAHIEDMNDVVRGIKILLKSQGFLAFEVHYLGNLISGKQYDMIYHEHQYYYSLMTLSNFLKTHDMTIFHVKPTPIHAGSMRFYVQKKNARRTISRSVKKLLGIERKLRLDKLPTYQKFSKKMERAKVELLNLLSRLKSQGKKIAGYGASGRATILLNYSGIDENFIDYIIDDSPARQNVYIPGAHVKTVSSKILQTNKKPDYILLFAWAFLNEVRDRNKEYLRDGGKFIIPLPKVKVL